MIEQQQDTPAAVVEPAIATFDLRKVTYGELLACMNGITNAEVATLVERVYNGNVGPIDQLSAAEYGYILTDFWDAINEALSPKRRGSG